MLMSAQFIWRDLGHSSAHRGDWLVISEFVGSHNRYWSFDLHIFYDQNEKEIDHLNIYQTVKMDDIPNNKATFSSS